LPAQSVTLALAGVPTTDDDPDVVAAIAILPSGRPYCIAPVGRPAGLFRRGPRPPQQAGSRMGCPPSWDYAPRRCCPGA